MDQSPSEKRRAYSAAHFVLEIGENKDKVGMCRSVEGGGVKADILTYRYGGDLGLFRQLGKPKYEDLKIQVGMSMSEKFYEWIEGFFSGKRVYKTGAILAGDFHLKERARRVFDNALISEVSIPKLDATDRNACYMGVTLVPETMRFEPGTGAPLDHDVGLGNQKLWTPNNFKMTIDGFDLAALRRVTRIDGFTIKQQILEYAYGGSRDPFRYPGIVEYPNLTFYVPEADADPFLKHFTERVIKGTPAKGEPADGTIEFTDHLLADLITINLTGIDIANVAPDKSDGASQEIKQVKIEISVESMKFKYKSGSTAQTA